MQPKKTIFIFSASAALLVSSALILNTLYFNIDAGKSFLSIPKREKLRGIHAALEYTNSMRANPVTGKIDPMTFYKACEQADALRQTNKTSPLGVTWIELGPDNVGGRTRALLIDKDNPNLMFAGSVAGGLWKSTTGGSNWSIISDETWNSLSLSSIVQTSNGDIYAGGGEYRLARVPNGNAQSGTIGYGIFKSTDRGITWKHLQSTKPSSTNSSSDKWSGVYKLAAHPTDSLTVYAGTEKGLLITSDSGATWKAVSGPPSTGYCTDVKIASDGTVIASVNNLVYRKLPAETDFTKISAGGVFPVSGVVRMEFAFAPSDPNYVYCAAASTGLDLENIYQSKDKGTTWTVIGPGGSNGYFYPFSQQDGTFGQGDYDNTIAVNPSDPEKIYVCGVSAWSWKYGKGWNLISNLSDFASNQYYVHADCHNIIFHPTDPNIMFITNDGGIFRTLHALDAQPTFAPMNKNYVTTQFYSIAAQADGSGVMGGTQDNGTQYVDSTGNTGQSAKELSGGDGGASEISAINPNAMLGGNPEGVVFRSSNKGSSFQRFYDDNIGTKPTGEFVTPFRLWESFNDINSRDSVEYVNCDTCSIINAGDTITVLSATSNYPFKYVTTQQINPDDTIKVQDIIQSRYFFGSGDALWLVKGILDFSKTPFWFKIAGLTGSVHTIAVSKDGDVAFVGVSGLLYRISGINSATYTVNIVNSKYITSVTGITTTLISTYSQIINGIAVDESDANHVVLCLGNYDFTNYVYRSTNALGVSPTFSSIQGALPDMPVYSAVIFDDPRYLSGSGFKWIVLGTELGIYATNVIPTTGAPDWYEENSGLGRVQVFQVRSYHYSPLPNQPWGGIRLYAGTHGRGLMKSETFLTGIPEEKVKNESDIVGKAKVYPNPVNETAIINFNLSNPCKVNAVIYDIHGRKTDNLNVGFVNAGVHDFEFNTTGYNKGTYFVTICTENKMVAASKFVVIR